MFDILDLVKEAARSHRRYADLAAHVRAMSGDERARRFRELEQRERALAAEKAAIVAEVDASREYVTDGHRSVAGWIRAHANPSDTTVRNLRRTATMCAAEPDVGDELLEGRLGVDQAAELARARSNPRCGEQLSEWLHLLLGHANGLKFSEFTQVVRRWEILADLDSAHRDRGDNIRSRRAAVVATADGVDVTASGGTAAQAARMGAILDAFVDVEFERDLADVRARRGDDAPAAELPRTDAQRRFDALVALFDTANNSPLDSTPAQAVVNVIVDQHTFEHALAEHGLADEPTDLLPPDPTSARCHTDRGVPLLPDDAVLASFGGWIRRVVVDSQDVVVNRGRKTRGFTGEAAAAARLLATRCELPGCTVPEHWSQIDHMNEWHEDGSSDQANSSIACGHHNRHKHRQGWRSRRDVYGQLRVRKPDGTWLVPVGVDPPTEDDFLTDEEIVRRIRARLLA